MDDKIICAHCGELECYKESMGDVDSFLCMGCGYTSTTLNKDGSVELRKWEMTTPELIKKAKFVDKDGLAWYPSVLNLPSTGLIFPDGVNENDWGWRVAKVVAIPEEDRNKYPIPGKQNEYYSTRLDMKNSKYFSRIDFKTACIELGIYKGE